MISHVCATYPDTAAIIVTGVDDQRLAGHALALGAYGYVVKPFSSTDLAIQVLNALRRRQLEIAQRHERERLEQMVAERTAELRRAVDERSHRRGGRRVRRADERQALQAGAVTRPGACPSTPCSQVCSRAVRRQQLTMLTQREREVLRLLSDGLRNEEIGRELHIAGETARAHIRNAMRKLDAERVRMPSPSRCDSR